MAAVKKSTAKATKTVKKQAVVADEKEKVSATGTPEKDKPKKSTLKKTDTEEPVTKKTTAKKPETKETVAKKSVTKKTTTKKTATKKTAAKKTISKKLPKAETENTSDANKVPIAITTVRKSKAKTGRKKAPKKKAATQQKVAPVQLAELPPSLGAYLTKDELAQLISSSSRTVERLVADGTITQIKNGRDVKFETVAVIKQYIQHLTDKANGKKEKDATKELTVQKLKAEIALKESQGELHRLRTDIASGKYIPLEEIKIEYSRMMVQLRNYILGIPNRITGRLSGRLKPMEVREVEKEVQEITTTMLRGFVQSAEVEDDPDEIPIPKGRTLNEKKSAENKI